MKLVEKKCPNCGAGLSFNKDSREVICEYCKKSYIIEKEESKDKGKNLEDYYKLVEEFNNHPIGKASKVMTIIIYVFSFLFFAFIFISMVLSFVEFRKGDSFLPKIESIKKDKYVTDISQIDEKSLEIFHKESLNTLNARITYEYGEATEWNYTGMYLLVAKSGNDNILYDVFKRNVTLDGKVYEMYGAVRYSFLKVGEDNTVLNNFTGYADLPMTFIKGSQFIMGYEGNESFYYKVIKSRSDQYDIKGTEGIFMES